MIFGEEDSEPMANPPAGNNPQQQRQVQIDASRMETVYSNLIFVSPAAEEIALYLGAHSMMPNANVPIAQLSHRLMLTPQNAKRLALMMQQAVKAFEDRFGPIEIGNPNNPAGG